jgi:hypothetical protein
MVKNKIKNKPNHGVGSRNINRQRVTTGEVGAHGKGEGGTRIYPLISHREWEKGGTLHRASQASSHPRLLAVAGMGSVESKQKHTFSTFHTNLGDA